VPTTSPEHFAPPPDVVPGTKERSVAIAPYDRKATGRELRQVVAIAQASPHCLVCRPSVAGRNRKHDLSGLTRSVGSDAHESYPILQWLVYSDTALR